MSEAIKGLQPEILWRKFAEVASIPRPSKHEEKIIAHVIGAANRLGLEVRQDGCGNVIVKKPASLGREQTASICLQSHLDMVPEKNAGKVHDFLNDPIELVRKGPVLTANGTTLGADNGIGVATSLAIMEDGSLEHGPLELLFTIDEETGLTGARHLDATLIESRTLLNLDSEEEGVLFVGCAGGRDTLGRWTVSWESPSDQSVPLLLSVKGLKGGHSGLEIDKGFGNAIKIANRAIRRLSHIGARLSWIKGGNMRNAIPRECEALLYLPAEQLAPAQELIKELTASYRAELSNLDPDLRIDLVQQGFTDTRRVLEASVQQQLCRSISALPHGVLRMSADISGLVETSTNVAVITTDEDHVVLVTSQRSSVASRLTEAVETVAAVFQLGGAMVETSDGYPGWRPNLASPILERAKRCYRSLYGKEPEVQAIHAGLECGIIGQRVPGMDMISFGPTMESVHSPDEKIYIETVEKFWNFLLAILRSEQ